MMAIPKERFPSLAGTHKCIWAPVVLSPILGSPECFVIAVAAASGRTYHLETANALSRLSALYGEASETVLFACEVALSEFEAALASDGQEALRPGAKVFSGITVGDVSRGEASSVAQLAKSWMSSLSSLYRVPVVNETAVLSEVEGDRLQYDRLPLLVHDHITTKHPSIAKYFSEEIQNRRERRSRPANISIDFMGSNIVANLATLSRGGHAKSVDMIKRKMFDLIVRRDQEKQSMFPRLHEMIVFSPTRDSPLVSERQAEFIEETHRLLEDQSKREGVTFVPLPEVESISERIAVRELRLQLQ